MGGLRSITRLLIGAFLLGVSWFLDRFRKPRDGERVVLRYSSFLFVVGFPGFLLCTLAIVAGIRASAHPVNLLWFILFDLLFLWMLLEFFGVRCELTEEGITYTEFLGQRLHIPWDKVMLVYYSPLAGWFGVVGPEMKVLRVSVMMLGVDVFARKVLEKVSPDVIEPPAQEALEKAARGKPLFKLF